jgi:hypothetical protein
MTIYHLGDEQKARRWPQLRDVVSPHLHDHHTTAETSLDCLGVHICSGTHPASYRRGTGGLVPESKSTGLCRCPLCSFQCRGLLTIRPHRVVLNKYWGDLAISYVLKQSWSSSIIIVSDYRLDNRCSIPGRGKVFSALASVFRPTLRTTQRPIQ